MKAVGGLLSDDVVWHVGGNNAIAGDYEGKEAVFGLFTTIFEETGGTFKNEIHDLMANDEHGVALVITSGTRGGKTLSARAAQVSHMRDGKLTEFWTFPEDQAAVDAFWA
jgi:hypothetical protein